MSLGKLISHQKNGSHNGTSTSTNTSDPGGLLHNKENNNIVLDPVKKTKDKTPTACCSMAVDMRNISEILIKKRQGEELSEEEIGRFITGITNGDVKDGQLGALITAFELKGCSDAECEFLVKAMTTTKERLEWPEKWLERKASLQSLGYTGNKAKPILAPAMAACGLKFPIMSSHGVDVFSGIIRKMSTIPGFSGERSWEDITHQLSKIGCCMVQQPDHLARGETAVRNMAAQVGVTRNNSLKAACLMARIHAMNLHAVVLTITYGPSEVLHTLEESQDLVKKMQALAKVVDTKLHVLLVHTSSTVGRMIGQSLEVAEVVKCLNGEGPTDLHDLVCKLGGHILHITGKADCPDSGYSMVDKVINDGSAKKRFMDMLVAQGVDKQDVRLLFKHQKHEDELPIVLPVAQYFTHLSTDEEGYLYSIDTEICSKVMFDLAYTAHSNKPCSGGIQLLLQIGSKVAKGQCWARLHHNQRLTEEHIEMLKKAITVRSEVPEYEIKIEVNKVT